MSATVPSTELISVVITCFDLEAYIEEAIRSALCQHDAGPFEVIVVDDCSTDRSVTIIEAIAGIRLVRMERNSGVMLATLAGVEAAQGDIVCFLDGDDLWEPGKLAAVRRAFADPQLALLTHDLAFIDRDARPLTRSSRPFEVFGRTDPARWPELVRKGILSLGDYVWLGSALCIRKSAARWGEFADWVRQLPDPGNLYQDWPLAYWVASLDGSVLGYLGQKLLRYRLHGANYSGDARTPERAARNYRRSFLTMAAIGKLAETRPAARSYAPGIVARARLYHASMLAYQAKRISAAGQLIKALPGLLGRRHEALAAFKLAGVILLGPRLAIRLKPDAD